MDQNKITTVTIELAPTQQAALDKIVEMTGKSPESIAQIAFDHGLESWDSLARLIEPDATTL